MGGSVLVLGVGHGYGVVGVGVGCSVRLGIETLPPHFVLIVDGAGEVGWWGGGDTCTLHSVHCA